MNDDTPRRPLNLNELLALLDDGETLDKFRTDHADLILSLRNAAEDHGKAKGGFTIKVDYTVERRGQVEITANLDTRLPKMPKGKAIAYVQGGDGIGAENPKQPKFNFAAAPRPVADVRSISSKDKE